MADTVRGVLEAASARAYLEDNVVPVLLQGLKVLCRERPENPVDSLALYLLKRNPNKNITVEVPIEATIPQHSK